MVCAVVWEYCKTNKPLCSWPKRWGIEELPQHWPSKNKRSCTSHVCLLPCDIIWYPPSHSVFCHTGSSWFALWLMLLHQLCEPAWEVRPTPTSMVYVLAFFRCLLSCHLITEGIPGLLTKILNLRVISQASLLDVYFLICVSCCNTIFFRISSLCYTKM